MTDGPMEQGGPEPSLDNSRLCENCGTTNTIQWRTGGGMILCNSCGIYFTRNKRHRSLKQNYPAFGIRAKQISFQLDTEASREQRRAREAAFPLEPEPHNSNLGKLSNIRRKQIELGLSHLYLRQQEQVQYYQRLSEAKPLSADSLTTQELAACLASKLQSQPTNPHNTPEAMQWLQSLQSPEPPPPPKPISIPFNTSFSNVKLKQMDLQLQHIPDRLLNEEKFHQRNQSASPLPISAYTPYLGNDISSPTETKNPHNMTSEYQIHTTNAIPTLMSPIPSPIPPPFQSSSIAMEIDCAKTSSNFQQLQNFFNISDPLPTRHSFTKYSNNPKPSPINPKLTNEVQPDLCHSELKYESVIPMNWWDICKSTMNPELQVGQQSNSETPQHDNMSCDALEEGWSIGGSIMEEGLEDSPFW